MKVDDQGQLRTFDTRVAGTCANGETRSVGWHPGGDGAPARFTGREEASGTIRYVARYRLTDGSATRCESPAVPWAAPAR